MIVDLSYNCNRGSMNKKGIAPKRDTNTFNWRLRQARDEMNISQVEMHNRIVSIVRRSEPDFSMTPAAYNKLEIGDTTNPKISVIAACGEILGISLDKLITGKDAEIEKGVFLHEESEKIAQLSDEMLPKSRRLMLIIAEYLTNEDDKERRRDQGITRFLDNVDHFLTNGQRKMAADILRSFRPDSQNQKEYSQSEQSDSLDIHDAQYR